MARTIISGQNAIPFAPRSSKSPQAEPDYCVTLWYIKRVLEARLGRFAAARKYGKLRRRQMQWGGLQFRT